MWITSDLLSRFLNAYWFKGPVFAENPDQAELVFQYHELCLELGTQ